MGVQGLLYDSFYMQTMVSTSRQYKHLTPPPKKDTDLPQFPPKAASPGGMF